MSVDQNLSGSFKRHSIAVLIPTYNNAGTLHQILEGVRDITSHIIVVNDGSTDNTLEILQRFPEVKVISYDNNVGKGWALRKGFKYALDLGYDYLITIDSDGQHFPDDIPLFLEELENNGPSLIIGARNMNQKSVPGKSSFGHRFSNFWFWVETGIKAPDTQSGYRLYPVRLLENTKYFSKKFEFEIEVIVRAAWKGIRIASVPIKVYYAPPGERVSHFRPFKDFTRISILNTILVFITLFYINPRNFTRAVFSKSTYSNLRNELFTTNEPIALTSFSVAFGVFMGIIPIWGFQMLVAITLAVLFRLNKALVLVSANISIPPMIPVIIFLSYKMGVLWVGDNAVPLSLNNEITLETAHMNFMQYVYGSITLAVLASVVFGLATFLFLTIKQKRKSSVVND